MTVTAAELPAALHQAAAPCETFADLHARLGGVPLSRILERHNRGVVTGPDGAVRLAPGLVRIPDVAFFSWKQFPNQQRPAQRVPNLVPDLAVEVLSERNTEAEMARKLDEYFRTGTRLVWYVDPERQTVRVYDSPTEFRLRTAADTLTGGDLLPGFRLPIRQWFARAWRQADPPAARKHVPSDGHRLASRGYLSQL